MPYVDLDTIHNPATGAVAPAAWGDQVRDNLEFLVDPPACSIKETTAQSVPNVTDTAMTSNEENFDNNSMHSTVTNTSRITIQTAGRYLLFSTLRFAGSTGGFYRQVQFLVNGATTYAMATATQVPNAGVETIISTSKALVLAAGDYVECMARHNAGGALNVNLDEFAAIFITR